MSKARRTNSAPTPTFIFFIEEVWRFPTGGEVAVSGKMVEGQWRGPCTGQVRLADATIIGVEVLGPAKTRTSRLERAATLRVSVTPGDEHRLRGGYLLGYAKA